MDRRGDRSTAAATDRQSAVAGAGAAAAAPDAASRARSSGRSSGDRAITSSRRTSGNQARRPQDSRLTSSFATHYHILR